MIVNNDAERLGERKHYKGRYLLAKTDRLFELFQADLTISAAMGQGIPEHLKSKIVMDVDGEGTYVGDGLFTINGREFFKESYAA